MLVRIKSGLLLFPLLYCFSCSGDKSIQGFDELPDGVNRGKLLHDTFTSLQLETSFRTEEDSTAAEGGSTALMIGEYRDIECKILLKFEDIPDHGTLTGASLSLEAFGAFTDTEEGSFDISVHEALQDWSEGTVRSESFNDNYSADILGTKNAALSLASSDSAAENTLQIDLLDSGVETISNWLATPTSNYGFLIDFGAANSVLEFYSSETGTTTFRPLLKLTFTSGDSTVTDSVSAAEDTYLTRELVPTPDGPALYVDNSFGHQSVLDFDLSDIPRESIINRAELVLHLIDDETVLSENGMALQIIRLDTNFVDATSFELPSSFFAISPAPTVRPDGSEVRISMLSFVQTWVSKITVNDNFGILIRALSPGRDVSRLAFISRSMDTDLAPRVEIDYSVAPGIAIGGQK